MKSIINNFCQYHSIHLYTEYNPDINTEKYGRSEIPEIKINLKSIKKSQ